MRFGLFVPVPGVILDRKKEEELFATANSKFFVSQLN